MKHPIQPLCVDMYGTTRFNKNSVVTHLLGVLHSHGYDTKSLDDLVFSAEDRQQFAQLIGCSLNEYKDMPYVDDIAYHLATTVQSSNNMDTEKIRYLEDKINKLKDAFVVPIAELLKYTSMT